MLIQPLHHWPLAAVMAVQHQAYASHWVEQAAVLQHKISADLPQRPLSWGAAPADAPAALCGYAIACPWRSSQPPQWNHATDVPPDQADCLYIHDIAIAPRHHGQRLAQILIHHVLQQGRACGWPQAVLVAVQGAQSYWRRHGFAPAPGPDLRSFGAGAVWMTRALTEIEAPERAF